MVDKHGIADVVLRAHLESLNGAIPTNPEELHAFGAELLSRYQLALSNNQDFPVDPIDSIILKDTNPSQEALILFLSQSSYEIEPGVVIPYAHAGLYEDATFVLNYLTNNHPDVAAAHMEKALAAIIEERHQLDFKGIMDKKMGYWRAGAGRGTDEETITQIIEFADNAIKEVEEVIENPIDNPSARLVIRTYGIALSMDEKITRADIRVTDNSRPSKLLAISDEYRKLPKDRLSEFSRYLFEAIL